MGYIDFMEKFHTSTKRDYLARVNDADKSECAVIAKKFDYDYWDGDRKYGYGGYVYDGRWKNIAEKMISYYGLESGQRILDVGCGKAHLLYEMKKIIPGLDVTGLDISEYAINNAKEEVKPFLVQGKAQELPYEENSFDFVFSLSSLHNLYIYDLKEAVKEIGRVSRGKSYIMVEAYRNEKEKMNLMYWQLTCECFFSTKEWEWLYKEWGYTGDYSFIFFM